MRTSIAERYRNRGRVFLHVIAPVVLACALYYVGRPFDGFAISHILPSPDGLSLAGSLPSWLVFNLPDGLWLYAFTTANILIWGGMLTRRSLPWIALVPVLGFGSEILQAANAFPGTFDPFDLLTYIVAVSLAMFHLVHNQLPHRPVTTA